MIAILKHIENGGKLHINIPPYMMRPRFEMSDDMARAMVENLEVAFKMTEELKRCPFCGSTQFTQEWHNNLDSYIECLDCGASACPAAWNRRASPWVSVEDGLPAVGELVLVRFYYPEQGNYEYKALRQYCESGWINPKNACCYDISSVTHWMPIPPLPETK